MSLNEEATSTEAPASSTSSSSATDNNGSTSSSTPATEAMPTAVSITVTSSNQSATLRSPSKNRGVIFPSVKNKPSLPNSTFTTDNLVNYKDVVKVYYYNAI